MNVALYARAVTHRRGDDRTTSQIEALRAFADQRGFKIVDRYICCDPNHSGVTLTRPGLSRLRHGAEAKAFDAVVLLAPDRLSRNCRDLLAMVEEFKRSEVLVVCLDENLQTTLPNGVLAISAQRNESIVRIVK